MLWLSYAIGAKSRILSCRPMRFLSGISMEMYLAQMIIFRLVEKLHLLYLFGGWISYIFAFILTSAVLIIFVQCYKLAVNLIGKFIKKHRCEKAK